MLNLASAVHLRLKFITWDMLFPRKVYLWTQKKFRAIMEWSTLRNVDDVISFIGLAGYYKRFIMNFFQISYPITSM